MAIVSLSPWPASGNDLTTAISTLKDAIKPGAGNDEIERLGKVASDRVENYAPGAPDATRTEALILFAGYLIETAGNSFGALRDETIDAGPVKLDYAYQANNGPAFRNCGAAGLLSPWKVRRAGLLKTGD